MLILIAYLVMNYVVVPLSRIGLRPTSLRVFVPAFIPRSAGCGVCNPWFLGFRYAQPRALCFCPLRELKSLGRSLREEPVRSCWYSCKRKIQN